MHDAVGVSSERYRAIIVAGGLLTFVLLFLGVLRTSEPPAPATADAETHVFSARRAAIHVRDLAGDGTPRPIGSAQHAARRDRVIALLSQAGLSPRVQRAFACIPPGQCATAENIVAEIPQARPPASQRAVLLTAHYDSVAAGPGASDDASSVAAIVEIARILQQESGRNRIVVLISDGEEFGLIGARAFVESHPEAKRVGAVVNLEARGTEGQSFLFETSRDNAWLVPLMSRFRRPSTSSLFYTIYERLPNDTDLSVYKRAGLQGVNFAFIEGVARYHTPVDSLAYLSFGSLQQQGENALSMTRSLRDADLSSPPRGNAIFFDVFSHFILWWPESFAIPLLVLVILLTAAAIAMHVRRGTLLPLSLGFGALCALAAVVLSVALGWLAVAILDWTGASGTGWMSAPGLARTAFVVGGVGSVLLAGIVVARYAGPVACWAATLTLFVLLSALLTFAAPGASYLTVPAAAILAGFGFIYDGDRPRIESAMIVLAIVASGTTMLRPAWMLYEAMGAPMLILTAALISVITMPLLIPLAAATRRTAKAFAWATSALSLVLFAIALTIPPFSESSPRHQNLVAHFDADAGSIRILAASGSGEVIAPLRGRMHRDAASPFPWIRGGAWWSAELPTTALQPPEVQLLESRAEPDGRRSMHLVLTSPRGAPRATLAFEDAGRIEAIAVNGWKLEPDDLRRHGSWSRIMIGTVGREEVHVDVVTKDGAPLAAILEDRSFGMPREALEFQQIRDHYAVPVQDGDVTIVTKRVVF